MEGTNQGETETESDGERDRGMGRKVRENLKDRQTIGERHTI